MDADKRRNNSINEQNSRRISLAKPFDPYKYVHEINNNNNDSEANKKKLMLIAPEKKQKKNKEEKELNNKKLKSNKGPYVLGEKLGEGAFAKVRLATQIHIKEKCAVKILEKRLLESSRDIQIIKVISKPFFIHLKGLKIT